MARDANVAETEWGNGECGYNPGDSLSATILTWMDGTVWFSTDIPYGINDLGNGTVLQCI